MSLSRCWDIIENVIMYEQLYYGFDFHDFLKFWKTRISIEIINMNTLWVVIFILLVISTVIGRLSGYPQFDRLFTLFDGYFTLSPLVENNFPLVEITLQLISTLAWKCSYFIIWTTGIDREYMVLYDNVISYFHQCHCFSWKIRFHFWHFFCNNGCWKNNFP
jgi:hypothetical protein